MLNILDRQNTVWFCSVPLEKDNSNQLTFANSSAQYNYFINKSNYTKINLSYIRQPVDGELKNYLHVDLSIEQLSNCNYVIIKNANVSKYYYAFIDRLEYKNPKVTFVHLSSDSFQTYQFDITYEKSFIERQTPLIDYPNCLSDEVAHGQLVENSCHVEFLKGGYFVFCTCDITQDVVTDSTPYKLQISQYTIPCWVLYFEQSEASAMGDVINAISDKGWADRILSVVYIPLPDKTLNFTKQHFNTINGVPEFNLVTVIDPLDLSKTISFDLPTFEDKKLKSLTYPYAKIIVEDMTTGQTTEFAPEKFAHNTIQFRLYTYISEKPHYKIIPLEYEGQSVAFNHAMVVECDTTLPIANNLYAKYLRQNKEQNQLAKFGAITGAMMGMVANPTGIVGNSLSTYQQLQGIAIKEHQASMLGNQVSSINDGAMDRIVYTQGFKISLYMMDNSHDSVAQSYWKMFGYPVKSLDYPNINGNDNYNFVKLAIPNIIGESVPQDELIKIKNMFYNGVTLWHNPSTFLQY